MLRSEYNARGIMNYYYMADIYDEKPFRFYYYCLELALHSLPLAQARTCSLFPLSILSHRF